MAVEAEALNTSSIFTTNNDDAIGLFKGTDEKDCAILINKKS